MKDFLEKIIILSKMIDLYEDKQTLTQMETGESDRNKRGSVDIIINVNNLTIIFYKIIPALEDREEDIFSIKYNSISNSITISNFEEFYSTKESTKILLEKLFLSLRCYVKENCEKNIKIIEDMML